MLAMCMGAEGKRKRERGAFGRCVVKSSACGHKMPYDQLYNRSISVSSTFVSLDALGYDNCDVTPAVLSCCVVRVSRRQLDTIVRFCGGEFPAVDACPDPMLDFPDEPRDFRWRPSAFMRATSTPTSRTLTRVSCQLGRDGLNPELSRCLAKGREFLKNYMKRVHRPRRKSFDRCRFVSCRVVSCRVVSCRVVSCRVCRVVSCRVVSCRVVSCRVVSCRVVSCRVVSCRVVSCRVVSCRVVSCRSCRVVSCRVVSCRVVSCRVVSCRVVSCRVVSCRVVSCRVVSCRVVSCRVVSCRVVSCRVVSCRVVSCRVVS
ncbi:hypothetical protein NP493_746g03003 [Ridgeia piscesae]|uniref:Uncharacterized protein n=1 Tax=Ridgeia piscesae TaxID=27915 RepID=A0AAD9NPZ2_RIDPI|nr:hypothetical protein NP493_746g03003 [Ridgeia piscesae]